MPEQEEPSHGGHEGQDGHERQDGHGGYAGHGGDDGHGGWDTPWAEPFAASSPERARLTSEFAAAVRMTGSLFQLVGLATAERIGINATDLNCLNILSFRGQLTAGELARATGLTTASITGVIDRLEDAGYVRRERDARDRRRVVVHLVVEKAVHDVAPVFLPLIRDCQQLAADYSDDELQLILAFYRRMEQVIRDHVVRLREAGAVPPP
ncbi:MAG TPA: MarR family transcriptional regulator [Streptosporangiaceae bacterium]